MSSKHVLDDYFDWLYFIVVRDNRIKRKSYRKLLSLLHSIDFEYSVDYDENRAYDGRNLRWWYVDDGGDASIFDWEQPCTVLEVLIGMAFQMKNIMEDPEEYTDVDRWFWMMLENIDLADMSNSKFNKRYVLDRVDMFMHRTYDSDGDGNIFYIKDCREDLREVELWCQMCWYLDSIL